MGPAQRSSSSCASLCCRHRCRYWLRSRCSPCGQQPVRDVPPELSALDRLRTLLLRGQPARVAPARDRPARQARVPLHQLDQARRASRGAPAASRSCARRVPPTPSCAASCACSSRRPAAFRSMDDDKSEHVCAPESKEMVRSFNLELWDDVEFEKLRVSVTSKRGQVRTVRMLPAHTCKVVHKLINKHTCMYKNLLDCLPDLDHPPIIQDSGLAYG